MPPTLDGFKREPETIDVDEMFEGVDITEVRSPAKAKAERGKTKCILSAHQPGSSQQPINLVSDDEDVTQMLSPSKRGVESAKALKEAHPEKLRGVLSVSSRPRKVENASSRAIPTPLAILGRAKTNTAAASPFTNVPRCSRNRPSSPVTNPEVTLIEDSDPDSMDVDAFSSPTLETSGGPARARARVRNFVQEEGDEDCDYFADFYSDDDDGEMSPDDEQDSQPRPPLFIDLQAMLMQDDERYTEGRDRRSGHPRVTSNIMRRPETSERLFQAKDPHIRLWDIPANAFTTSPYESLGVDLPKRIVRRGIFSTGSSSRSRHTSLNCGLTATVLRLTCPQYKKTSGSITKIVQSCGYIAIASATSGGGPDSPSSPDNPTPERPQVDPYNTDGNLLIWNEQEFHKFEKSHERTWIVNANVGEQQQSKVYTVNDVAFDPQRPGRLVSSGNDCIVSVWDVQKRAEINKLQYSDAPHDIAFKPDSSVFAVSCFDGNVHVHSDNLNERFALKVVSDPATSKPGSFLWGGTSHNQGLSNMIFASSESEDESVNCQHVAFDVSQGREAYVFKVYDSGDSMALGPKGDSLALITNSEDAHTLFLFDVARANGKRPTAEITLPPQAHVPADAGAAHVGGLEVSFAAYSPDGVFLALARTDNITLVYDVRFLGDGRPGSARPWVCLRHPRREPTVGYGYGTTGLRWVEGFARGSLGLVTAASDGCVRLWDVMRAPTSEEESLVIAEVDHDVACLSIGDQSKNERRLVVGDCGGEVYIFD